jgi:hypothetical protein
MDHKSIQTTGGYYTITADRKRSTIDTVGQLAIDKRVFISACVRWFKNRTMNKTEALP